MLHIRTVPRRRPGSRRSCLDWAPTCDDLDHMAGPFELPADVGAGDYLEIGMLGAYGCAMRTGFNGFGVEGVHIVDDEPMASLYGATEPARRSKAVKR